MKEFLPKRPRARLEAARYKELRQQVLERDGWRCQFCGSMSNLEVHHLEYRSRRGADAEENLLTLCRRCHSILHEGVLRIGRPS